MDEWRREHDRKKTKNKLAIVVNLCKGRLGGHEKQ